MNNTQTTPTTNTTTNTATNLLTNFINQDVMVSIKDTDEGTPIEGKIIAVDNQGFVVEETGSVGDTRGKPVHCWYPTSAVRYVQLTAGTLQNLKAA